MLVDDLANDLRIDEGFVPHGYDDKTGKAVTCEGWLTAGYGFLIDARKGAGIPRPVAEYWLRYAINERVDELRKQWPAFDRQPYDVQRAVGNMAYQLGAHGVLGFPKMLLWLVMGDRAAAANEALDSEWARTQTPKRAKRVAALIRGHA